jgi:hypothetical protein
MRIYFFAVAIFVVVLTPIAGFCQKGKPSPIKECLPNSESLYDRRQILNQLAEILNKSVPEDRTILGRKGYHVNDEGRGVGFFIYDLTNPSNKETTLRDCIEFKNNHIYHFAPISKRHSFSHIVVLEDGNLKVFKSINCKDKGDSLEDVINYVSLKLKDDENKDEILNRIKDYRKYGIYTTVDTPNLQCG